MRPPLLLALALLGVAGCPSSPTPLHDGSLDLGVVDVPPEVARPDVPAPRFPVCEETEAMPVVLPPVASTLVATIVPANARAASAEAGRDPVYQAHEAYWRGRGMDRYAAGPGQARVRRTELGDATMPAGERRSLTWFVHLSDLQLSDDESPGRLALLDTPAASGAIRPQEAYLPRVLSAMNRTLAQASATRPFQFGVVSGDCSDSAQRNELRWFIQIMDGARGVHTDSGEIIDLVPGPDNDPKDPFDAVAFPAPWYYVPGNHDTEVMGVNPVSTALSAVATGRSSALGTRDYATRAGDPRSGQVAPDPERRLLTRAEIPPLLRASAATPGPVGHGYPESPDLSHGANYVIDVVPGLLRLIALDTADATGGSLGVIRRDTIDGFLTPALDRAQADGVLVLLTSHHRPATMDRLQGQFGPDQVPGSVDPAELATLVARHPEVIAWLVGHEHDVLVRPVRGADMAHPGYWEIESGSLADWPSESRILELVDNGNGTLSLFGTMIDFQAPTCQERRFRRLSIIDYVTAWSERLIHGEPGNLNVELVVPVPASAAAHVAAARAAAPTRIESLTTLAGMP